VLVDVRTEAEWSYVGLPDLGPLGKQPVRLSWQVYPAMTVDPGFADRLAAAGVSPDHHVMFLCRSGVRSLAAARLMTERGYGHCYNITNGFEGPHDGTRHRGTVAGWKHDGLPWVQG
jgi:rhodanese-related sulfurtransferase